MQVSVFFAKSPFSVPGPSVEWSPSGGDSSCWRMAESGKQFVRLLRRSSSRLVQAVTAYMDLAQLECDTALEAAMRSDDEDIDWLY